MANIAISYDHHNDDNQKFLHVEKSEYRGAMINIDSRLLCDLSDSEFRLLCYLGSRMNKERITWPKNKTITSDLKWSTDKLQSVKKKLVDRKVIEISSGWDGAAQTSNRYRIINTHIGVYSPGKKHDGVEVSIPVIENILPSPPEPSTSAQSENSGYSPLAISGNKVLYTEVLSTEVSNIEELRIEELNIRDVFTNLIDCFFPDYKHSHALTYCYEKEKLNKSVLELLKKIDGAAREIYSAIKSIGRNKILVDDNLKFSRSSGKVSPREDAIDQIKAYHDYCRLTQTYITTNPEYIPEKIISADWCQKLYDWASPRIDNEKYDPATDDDLLSYWLNEIFYVDGVVQMCRRYSNRVVVYGDEYLLNKR